MSFIKTLKRIVNTGQSRSIVLVGNVYDLFFDGTNYVPLVQYLCSQCVAKLEPNSKGITRVVYELNHPIELIGENSNEILEKWDVVNNPSNYRKPYTQLSKRLTECISNATFALELLRQMAKINRMVSPSSKNNLLMFIEAADLILPDEEISKMSIPDRHRIAIVQDWLSDPDFMSAGDSVVLIAESRSSLHHRIARLPQILSVDVPLPDLTARKDFIEWLCTQVESVRNLFMSGPSSPTCGNYNFNVIAKQTSGLSLHAVRQLLLSGDLSPENINSKIEEYMIGQLGDGVIEFQKPKHKLSDLVGFKRIKAFMKEDLIPGFLNGSTSGAVVGGPIGGGKTYICEAVASELDVPVITLKNIRSKWFGETDQIFERLRRLLETFNKVVIFVDEADTQFGGVEDGHETERRLTGKIQAMMSDSNLKGRVIWFLMTARIHKLSPDIRRPGRMDLIIPILDPEEYDDVSEFISWTFASVPGIDPKDDRIRLAVKEFSTATFAMLRSQLKAKNCQTIEEALAVAEDILQPDIGTTRRYQTLQALLNCTKKSLIFDPSEKNVEDRIKAWKQELKCLEV